MEDTIESRMIPGYNLKDILKLIDTFNFAYNFSLIQTVLISNTYHISILNLEIDWSKTNNLDLTLSNIRKVLDLYSFYVSDNGRYKTCLLRNF